MTKIVGSSHAVLTIVQIIGGRVALATVAGHISLIAAIGAQNAKVMLRELIMAFGGDAIAGGTRIPGQGHVPIENLLSGTPDLDLGMIALIGVIFRVFTPLSAGSNPPLIGTVFHNA